MRPGMETVADCLGNLIPGVLSYRRLAARGHDWAPRSPRAPAPFTPGGSSASTAPCLPCAKHRARRVGRQGNRVQVDLGRAGTMRVVDCLVACHLLKPIAGRCTRNAVLSGRVTPAGSLHTAMPTKNRCRTPRAVGQCRRPSSAQGQELGLQIGALGQHRVDRVVGARATAPQKPRFAPCAPQPLRHGLGEGGRFDMV